MRRAADLSMALRDYEGAAGLYRLLAADYKADKAWRRRGRWRARVDTSGSC